LRVHAKFLGLVTLLSLAGHALAQQSSESGSVAASVYTPSTSSGGMVWLSFVTLVLLAGGVVLIAWLVRRNTSSMSQGSSIRVLAAQMIGPRERVVIVSMAGRVFVLGHTASNISLLAELEPEEVAGLSSMPVSQDFSSKLSELIGKVRR
jgi:flagellar protein FliO/FliZ